MSYSQHSELTTTGPEGQADFEKWERQKEKKDNASYLGAGSFSSTLTEIFSQEVSSIFKLL